MRKRSIAARKKDTKKAVVIAAKRVRYEFVEQHREEFEVNLMCELLNISRRGYYAWQMRGISQREMANQQLLVKIRAAYAANRGCYGSPRIYQEVKEEVPCSLNRVARLMQQRYPCQAGQTIQNNHPTQ